MSVDERVRAAFQEDEDGWIDVEQALVATTRRTRRESRRRLGVTVGGLAAAAVVVAAVVTTGNRSGGNDPVTPPPSVSVGPLEGRWRTPPITRADVHQALTAAGAGHYTDQLMRGLPATPWTLTLQVAADGNWILRLNTDRRTVPIDDERVEVSGSSLEIFPDEYPFGTISSTFAFTLYGDAPSRKLALQLEGSSEVRTGLIPNHVYLRAFYMTKPFLELP